MHKSIPTFFIYKKFKKQLSFLSVFYLAICFMKASKIFGKHYLFQHNLKNIPLAPPSAAPQGAVAPWGVGSFNLFLKYMCSKQKTWTYAKSYFQTGPNPGFSKFQCHELPHEFQFSFFPGSPWREIKLKVISIRTHWLRGPFM